MKVREVHVDYRVRPHSADAPRDALQTLSGGGSVTVRVVADDGLEGIADSHFGRVDGAPATLFAAVERADGGVVGGADVLGVRMPRRCGLGGAGVFTVAVWS